MAFKRSHYLKKKKKKKKKIGRPRKTNSEEDKLIVDTVMDNKWQKLDDIMPGITNTLTISKRTIEQRLRESEIKSRVAVIKERLTEAH